MPTMIEEKRNELWAAQKSLGDKIKECMVEGGEYDLSKLTSVEGTDDYKRSYLRELNQKAEGLYGELSVMTEVQRIADAASKRNQEMQEPKEKAPRMDLTPPKDQETPKLGQMVMQSEQYKNKPHYGSEYAVVLDYDINTLMSTTAGFGPEALRTGLIVPSAQRPVQVTDLFPLVETSQHAVVYMEETTFTNAAAEVEEGGQSPEAALVYTERTSPIKQISVRLPVTEIQLEDEMRVSTLISQRLPFMLRQRLDEQLINGSQASNNTQNIVGLTNTTGIGTYTRTGGTSGSAVHIEDVFNAMQQVRYTAFAMPNAIILDNATSTTVRLAKDTQNRYLFGAPSMGDSMMIWGLPYAVSTELAANTAIVGDFANFTEICWRRGITIAQERTGDQFIEHKLTIRADLRCTMIVTRPAAIIHIVAP